MIKIYVMKNITKLLTLIILSTLIIPGLNAQDREERHRERREYYRSMKIAYFTEEMKFTPEEAEKFWPVYNEFDKKEHEIEMRQREGWRKLDEDGDDLTEKEAAELSELYVETLKQETEIQIDFHHKMLEILPVQKVMKIYITEVRFREHMLRRIRDEREKDRGERNIPQP